MSDSDEKEQSNNKTMILENIKDQKVTIKSKGKEYVFAPHERKTVMLDEFELKEYEDGVLNIGCVFIAVEIDGKRYEYCKDNISGWKITDIPVFKPEYFWAFMALVLYKIGDVEMITLERLEQFDAEKDCPEVIWVAEKKAWMMKNKKIDRPTIITPTKKVQKQMLKNFLSHRRN